MEPLVTPQPAAPQHLLVHAPDHAVDVEAPRRVRAAARVAKRAKRYGELGGPAVGRSKRPDLPDPPPVDVELAALVGEERVELGAVRVGGEDDAVAVVVEGIEQDGDGVVPGEHRHALEGRQLHDAVALQDPRDDRVGFAIAGDHPHIQVLGVVDDPHLGGFAGRGALERLTLTEARRHRRAPPYRLVQRAIHDHLTGVGARAYGRARRPSGALRRRRRAPQKQDGTGPEQTGDSEPQVSVAQRPRHVRVYQRGTRTAPTCRGDRLSQEPESREAKCSVGKKRRRPPRREPAGPRHRPGTPGGPPSV